MYYSNRARCYSLLKQWELVEADGKKAAAIDVKNIKAHYLLGMALVELGRTDEDIERIEKGL